MPYTTIVNAGIVSKHLDDPGWVIVDCRFDLAHPNAGSMAYKDSHIPNAVYAHLDNDLSGEINMNSGRHPLPAVDKFKNTLSNLGINSNKQVVVYDDAGGSMAARLWWLLKWLNHDNVALLDGGFTYWLNSQLPLSTEVNIVQSTRFDNNINATRFVNSDIVEKIRNDSHYRLIDVRARERFEGLAEPIDKIAGHIPGAVNVPWQSSLDSVGLFLPKSKLQSLYLSILGNIAPENTVVMCGSGVTACHTLIALEHAGFTGAKLYPGSWSEWITNPDHAIECYGDR